MLIVEWSTRRVSLALRRMQLAKVRDWAHARRMGKVMVIAAAIGMLTSAALASDVDVLELDGATFSAEHGNLQGDGLARCHGGADESDAIRRLVEH
ncbi:MAG: hypothetical protein AAFX81_19140, partial [Pseudomonadota bacterium]